MNITVYLGALEGNDHTLTEAVRELGIWIGESGLENCRVSLTRSLGGRLFKGTIVTGNK